MGLKEGQTGCWCPTPLKIPMWYTTLVIASVHKISLINPTALIKVDLHSILLFFFCFYFDAFIYLYFAGRSMQCCYETNQVIPKNPLDTKCNYAFFTWKTSAFIGAYATYEWVAESPMCPDCISLFLTSVGQRDIIKIVTRESLKQRKETNKATKNIKQETF